MVNLVLVSHSRALAESTAALVKQVAAGRVSIAIAAGVGEQRQEFGTDAVEISEAIQHVDNADGVLVLMDLGSAILSAEMALDLLPDDLRKRVRLCPAPFIEGAISAAIQAGLGADLDTVCREASQALHPKLEQLGAAIQPAPRVAAEQVIQPPGTTSATVTLINPHGLHARPAARFIQTAASFDAEVHVQKAGSGSSPVSAKSLNKLATLGAAQGDQIIINASGPQSAQALQALVDLVQDGFGEVEAMRGAGNTVISAASRPVPLTSLEETALKAVPVSEGIAIGTLRRLHAAPSPAPRAAAVATDPAREWQHLIQAIKTCADAIDKRIAQLGNGGVVKQTGIFTAHRLILDDEMLTGRARELIEHNHHSAETAWQTAIDEVVVAYRNLPDAYMRERATDVLDIGAQVLAALSDGESAISLDFPDAVILASDEFTPAQVAQFEPANVLGLISAAGSASSHASILARALGIPAVAGAGGMIDALTEGATVGLDATSGAIWVNPTSDVIQALTAKRKSWLETRRRLQQQSQSLTLTRDGHRVELAANLSGLADARVALQNGAEAVGVLRTEFLYMTRASAPSEDEQVDTLRQVAEAMQGRPTIVRTLDVGGDKSIPYLHLPVEANPFLGMRAIRLSLQQPELFVTQIRAILRAGVGHNLRILLPMVSLVEELAEARDIIEQAHNTLSSDGIVHAWPMQVGIMIETPSAALMASIFAPMVDFFSIGTNDLTQYTLAAERGNSQVAYLSDALHPSVLRLVNEVTQAAHRHGKWSAVCGEVAADATAAPVLVGLEVDELSMNVAAIPAIKAVVRSLEYETSRTLAQAALLARTAGDVRRLVRDRSTSTSG
ncbi:MAG: phosphoenolpyruvate--protein phosphotransferase [Chloroflexi bacterium]|nr:phosphoenolpyruvate--protein phosphotransferase [Chloroflexota bacterium]MCL5275242.1 phosphoenolpyruvate--protein phosphotransferase [Chloroflexota bacterium]